MQSNINDVRKQLDILDNVKDNPELILTELFFGKKVTTRILNEIYIDGKESRVYLEENLKEIPVFDNTHISCNSYTFNIRMKSFQRESSYSFYSDGYQVMDIDAKNKTYRFYDEDIRRLKQYLEMPSIPDTYELDDLWKELSDMTIKHRIKKAPSCLLRKNTSLKTNIMDFFFWLFIPASKVYPKVEEEKQKIKERNDYEKKRYDEKVRDANYFETVVPDYIDTLINKRNKIANYLDTLGYRKTK